MSHSTPPQSFRSLVRAKSQPMDRQRLTRRIAGGLMVLAGIVLIVTPYLLNAPNAIGLAVGIVSVLIGLGVAGGQLWTVAVVWSAIGLGASVIWALLALSVSALQPLVDDVVEAVVLAALFAGALIALVLARRRAAPRPASR